MRRPRNERGGQSGASRRGQGPRRHGQQRQGQQGQQGPMAGRQTTPPHQAAPQQTTRLFFAAWPSPEIQQMLGGVAQRAQRECGGQPTPDHNIHLTLLFLGGIAHERLTELETLAATVRAPRFTLAVDRLDYWKHNRILWAGVKESPEALRALVSQLEKTLGAVGFRFDQRSYVPHITLLRESHRAPAQPAVPPIEWAVEEFVLVESVQLDESRVYEVLHRWPLTGS